MRMLFFLVALLYATGASAEFGPYAANVVRVIDGDTIEVDVVIWPQLTQRAVIRIAGIDTPEMKGCAAAKADEARQFLLAFVSPGPVKVTIISFDKYQPRYDGRIAVAGKDAGSALIAAGLAHVYDGTGKRVPWC